MEPEASAVRVAVRIRPLSQQEAATSSHVCIRTTPGEPQVIVGSGNAFTFDYVFPMDSTQAQIYDDCVNPLVEAAFEGFNATILAYGQTGSGKTYTMGSSSNFRIADEQQGIIPRVINNMFEMIESRERENPNINYTVRVQFLEIYGETIKDLLSPESDSHVTIRETANGEVYVAGAHEQVVASAEEMMMTLEQGSMGRTVGSTLMNAQSSRSHAIFTIILEQRISVALPGANAGDANEDGATAVPEGPEVSFAAGEPEIRKCKFHFVDLAGSERAKRTGAEGQRLKEGIDINQGLLVLGNVISALGDEKKRGKVHVPYRDSKLTRMLQDSLGGNSRTLMICCVSPADSNLNESLNAVRYANRARNIQNKPVVNRDANSALITELRRQVQLLATELLKYRSEGKGGDGSSGTTREMLQMLATQNLGSTTGSSSVGGNAAMTVKSGANAAELAKLQDEISLLRSQLTDSDYEIQRLTDQLKRVRGEQSTVVEQVSVLTAERDFYRFKWAEACPTEANELLAHQSAPVDGVSVAETASTNVSELPDQLVIVNADTKRAMTGQEGVGRQKDAFVTVIQAYEQKLRELQDKLTESELARKLQAPAPTWSPGGFGAPPLAPEDSGLEMDLAESFAKVIVRAQRQIKDDERRLQAYAKKHGSNGDLDDVLSTIDDEDALAEDGDMEDIEQLNVTYKRRQKDLTSQVSHLTEGIQMKEQLVQQLLLSQQKYQAMVASFQQRLQEAAEEIARSEQERQKLVAELEELERRQQQQPEKPQSENDRRRQAELQDQLRAKDAHLVELRKKEQQLQQHSKLRQKAAEQLNAVKAEITEMKRQKIELNKKIEQERREHMKTLGQRAKEIEKLRRDLAKSKQEIQRLGNQTEKLERLAKRRTEEANIQRRRVNELSKVSGVQGNASSAVRKAISQRSQRRPLNEDELKLRAWIEKRTREISVREARLDELRTQYEKRTKLSSEKQELERTRDTLTVRLHTSNDPQMQEELELQLTDVSDQLEEIEQQISYESQRIQEMEQQFTQEDNCNVDRALDQLRQHIKTLTEAHMIIRQLFEMLMQSRTTATQRKQKLLAAEAQAKSLTEQVEDLQSRIETDKQRYDRKLAQVQFEYEEKINALIDHTSAQTFGGPLFADAEDAAHPEEAGGDFYSPRRSFGTSPFKGSSMDSMSADQLRSMLTLSNERTSFLKKQVERLQAELDSRTNFVEEVETHRRQTQLELLERKRDIEFLEAENATMREIISEYKERLKSVSGGDAITRQVRDATKHRRNTSELPTSFNSVSANPSWKTNPLFEEEENDDDSDTESMIHRFDDITEEVNRFGSVGRHPHEQEAAYTNVFDKLTNPQTFTGIHKALMTDQSKKKAKAKAIKKEVDNTRSSVRMKKAALTGQPTDATPSTTARAQSPLDAAKFEDLGHSEVIYEDEIDLVDAGAFEPDGPETPSPAPDATEGDDSPEKTDLESKPSPVEQQKRREDVFTRLVSNVTEAERMKRQEKEQAQKGTFSAFRRK